MQCIVHDQGTDERRGCIANLFPLDLDGRDNSNRSLSLARERPEITNLARRVGPPGLKHAWVDRAQAASIISSAVVPNTAFVSGSNLRHFPRSTTRPIHFVIAVASDDSKHTALVELERFRRDYNANSSSSFFKLLPGGGVTTARALNFEPIR